MIFNFLCLLTLIIHNQWISRVKRQRNLIFTWIWFWPVTYTCVCGYKHYISFVRKVLLHVINLHIKRPWKFCWQKKIKHFFMWGWSCILVLTEDYGVMLGLGNRFNIVTWLCIFYTSSFVLVRSQSPLPYKPVTCNQHDP